MYEQNFKKLMRKPDTDRILTFKSSRIESSVLKSAESNHESNLNF